MSSLSSKFNLSHKRFVRYFSADIDMFNTYRFDKELLACAVIWFSCFVYSLLRLYEVGWEMLNAGVLERYDFADGWSRFIPEQDKSDYEWTLWTSLLVKLIPWTVLHLILCECVRALNSHLIPLVHVVVTMLALLFTMPLLVSAIFLIEVLAFYVVMLSGSKSMVWILAIVVLTVMNHIDFKAFISISYDNMNLVSISLGWFLIKCIDYCLEVIHEPSGSFHKLSCFFGFVFYFPNFFLGPFIPYSSFRLSLFRAFSPWTPRRCKRFLTELIKVLLWYFLFELSSHFLYCHSMHYKVEAIQRAGLWALNGVGLCMAQFFFLKYLVVYGASLSIARVELYDAPPNPKCINRIHLYSKMWRHFDRGFYLFLISCIYRPVLSGSTQLHRRFFASFLCFSFVFVWHGINYTIFIWSLMNFIGVALEAILKIFQNSKFYSRIRRAISSPVLLRLECALCSPLWVMAVISNFVFFGGHELGMIYFQQIKAASWTFHIFLFVVGYAMCQISIKTTQYEIHRHSQNLLVR